jgi:hypothetical protein
MEEAKPLTTPMTPGFQVYESTERTDVPYIELIGSIGYLAKTTRPDIAFAYSYLGRFSKKPTEAVWNEAKRVLRYLSGTIDYKLTYTNDKNTAPKIISYCDASFANCEDNFSTTGYVIFFKGNLIQWKSKKQQVPSASTTVAEIYALIECLKESIYLKEMISELTQEQIELEIFCDNKATIAIATNEIVNGKSKYILSKIAFLRYHLKMKTYKLNYIQTNANLADILTKAASTKVFKEHVQLLGLSGLLESRPKVISEINNMPNNLNPQTSNARRIVEQTEIT